MTFGSLFAGIGGMDLGLERAGMVCKWQVEIDPYCHKVLAKHWPAVKRYGDIREVTELEYVDCIAGGFPCQDVSVAGLRAGIDGERSGLWSEMLRIIRLVRPSYALVENVPGLLTRGMGRVLGDLAESGYDAEWSTVSACSLGATHMRRRLFIVAYPNCINGRPRVWHSDARTIRPLQVIDSFESTRSSQKKRMANPSKLYGGADGLPCGMAANHGVGNSVYPPLAEWLGSCLMEAHNAVV